MKECQKSETVTIKTGNSSSFKYVSASRDVKGIDSALNAGVAVENSLLAVKKCKEMIEAIPQFRKSPITTPR